MRRSAVKPMKNMAVPTTVFHSFVLLFISAKLSLNLRRYTEERKDSAAGIEDPRLEVELHNKAGGKERKMHEVCAGWKKPEILI